MYRRRKTMTRSPTPEPKGYCEDWNEVWHRVKPGSFIDSDDTCVPLCSEKRQLPRAMAGHVPPDKLCTACLDTNPNPNRRPQMPKVSEMKSSKYLKKEDVGEEGTVVTIVNVHQVNVA